MSKDFTRDEKKGAKAILEATTDQRRTAKEIVAELERGRARAATLRAKAENATRGQLPGIYELFVPALAGEEVAGKVFGVAEGDQFSDSGGVSLNGLIVRFTDLSKQRACTLAMVLRYAAHLRISWKEFPSWLASVGNMDEVARHYSDLLRSQSGADAESSQLKPKMGEGWHRIAKTLERALKSGRPIKFRARLQCWPGGKVHFIKQLAKPTE